MITEFFKRLFTQAEQEVEVTLDHVHDHLAAAYAAKTSYVEELDAAAEAARAHNAQQQAGINALSSAIAAKQLQIEKASATLAAINDEKAKAA